MLTNENNPFLIAGRKILGAAQTCGEMVVLMRRTFYWMGRTPIDRFSLFYQMVEMGNRSLPVVSLTMIFAGMVIVFRTKNVFLQLVALGLVGLIGFEAVINIGVSIGALPTKGLSLPFISYGGTALMANMMALGLLLNISREIPENP